ncbi:MAG: TCP-1/cpn60 chaperonin family protein [Nitrososphaerota archaeon]|nr:TCP-1/cpn60 chaperonin family protein [Nitrososphaerota archaeon]MDG6966540.1 TCP-1/cpn60 chaperonin family protein [Nitrososphaerota archaeon]MDG6978601.1 TCP-1/cpn60 chaperonin family protein [Nitrososphaerota archaeon]MDG7021441.1 TCP-1/cpn60 chaperonin family protein [Nitrososphaerota archaeon]MDG7022510.1 TCP-1/cpn60 chaperonin family protein [Nitrososphaerota archaeon]
MSTQAIPAVTSGGQPVLILKEGSNQSRGREASRNNIQAAKLVAEIVKSSIGPRGMDKMLVDSLGDVTITNDGATMLKEIDVQHPAAKMLVEVSKATDNEVGDGTTSAVILAGALLEKAEALVDKGVHPTIIVEGYNKAAAQAIKVLGEIAQKVPPNGKDALTKIARTSMQTKLVSRDAQGLAELIVDAVLQVAEKTDAGGYKVDLDNIKVEKKPGGSMHDTKLIKGIVLDKEVVHAGMPKRVEKAKIALVNAAFEIEKTEFDAKLNISDPSMMKKFLDEETRMLKGMSDKVVSIGANVLVCQKGMDDIAQHYLAKAGVLAVRRAKESDLTKLAKATGARIANNFDDLTAGDLGFADLVEERKVEQDKWVFVEGCKNPKAVSILIRGGTQRIVDEAERSMHDALMVSKDVVEKPAVVAGGGAPEAEVAAQIMKWTEKLTGREQLAAQKFADALETIPVCLATNAGLDPIDTMTELRAKHAEGGVWFGVEAKAGKVKDMYKENVIEPLSVKEQIVKSATEAASMILRIDDVIAAGKSKGPAGPPGGAGGMGGGEGEFD